MKFKDMLKMACWESGPQRAPSSATASADLVTITAWEEPQLLQGAPVTVAATRSSEAENTTPCTTGSGGAGRGGTGGLISATPAGGDDKVIATKILGTVKWFIVRNG